MDDSPNKLIPDLPTFPKDLIEECDKNKDYRPILFEWYKYIGVFCNTVACFSPNSPALRKIPSVHYQVLTGLLNRCSRLMLSNVRLSSTRRYGETTVLLDRSIQESAIKIQWLCLQDDREGFFLYLADGLKKDLMLKNNILENIKKRNGEVLVIERRMLDSIQKCVELSQLSEQEIMRARRLPSFEKMCQDLGLQEGFYIAIQRMGSHAVHGTWSELIFHYLSEDEGNLHPRDHDVDTQDAQFISVIHLVLSAMSSFLNYLVTDSSDSEGFTTILNHVTEQIREIQKKAWGTDFGKAEQ